MVFLQEEIHIVELHGIRAILNFQVAEDRFCARRGFHQFTISVDGVDTAEAATERTTNARVMRRRPFPEK